jgi:L-fuconolactonase
VRVDAHVHIWDLDVRDQPWTADLRPLRRSFPLSELAPALADHAIDAAVLVQTVCVPEETPEFLALADARTVVAGVVGWVDLTAADVASRLAALRALPGGSALVGVRHQVQDEPNPRWLCRDDVRRGLAEVAAAGLVYELVVRPPQLEATIETAQALTELRFVLDHGGKPELTRPPAPQWTAALTALGALPNVAAKLSGLTSEAGTGWTVDDLRPFGDALLGAFGSDRLLFGSDWPVCLLGGGYDPTIDAMEALTAGLSSAERAAVFGETATRVYGLVT